MDGYEDSKCFVEVCHPQLQQLGGHAADRGSPATTNATNLEFSQPDDSYCESSALRNDLTSLYVDEPYLNNVDWYNFTSEDLLTLFRLADANQLPVNPKQQSTPEDRREHSSDEPIKPTPPCIDSQHEPDCVSYTHQHYPPERVIGVHTDRPVQARQTGIHVRDEASDCLLNSEGALSAVPSAPPANPVDRPHQVLTDVDSSPPASSVDAAKPTEIDVPDLDLAIDESGFSNPLTSSIKKPQSCAIAADVANKVALRARAVQVRQVRRKQTCAKQKPSDQACFRGFSSRSSYLSHCAYCQKAFSYKSALVRHERTHTGEKPLAYDNCEKDNKTRHERTHTGYKPFARTHCKKAFSNDSDKVKPERTHTGEKPFTCSHCPKSFSCQSHKIIHERIHTGEKPFACSYCKKTFSAKGNMVTHERIHTGERPFGCTYCKKTFHKKSRMVMHELIHTGEKPFGCAICKRTFRHRSSMVRHQRTHKQ